MELIKNYFPDFTEEQLALFAKLPELYEDWNSMINVISRKDLDQLTLRHVLHSLSILKFHPLPKGISLVDIGTGGGFPGIPLAIACPDIEFTLVDSIGKKIKVVNAVADALGLKNVIGIHSRGEDLKDRYDIVTARAVTRLAPLWKWSKQVLRNPQTGKLITLKGGELDDEIEEFEEINPLYRVQKFDLKEQFSNEFFETKQLLVVEKKP